MNLASHIEDVRAGIKAGRFKNEAAVSQGIVLRLLRELGWPIYDTQVVCPEYALEGRRVDFALCHPANKPTAFIEVKKIGQSDGAERQLFEYAFHLGVPLAILTDGQEWNFFLPAAQGDYSERRVYKLDILERDLSECVTRLERYLGHVQVSSGAAIAAAHEDYRNVTRDRQMLATLPDAWSKLVAEEDELLLEIIADKVESLCGFKPDIDSVAKFLRENVSLRIAVGTSPGTPAPACGVSTPTPIPPAQSHLPTKSPDEPAAPAAIGFTLQGRFVPCRNGKDVLVKVFEALASQDQTFLESFAARPKHGRTRRYLARSPDALYPGRPDLAQEHSHKLTSGWFVGTNVSHAAIERIIEMACEVARLRFGRDLLVNAGQ
jgi:predicted type IV restriction endonuclease